MQAKLFEIRDRGTFFPALAVKIEAANEAERYLIRRAGFSLPSDMVYFAHMEDKLIHYDHFEWGGNRSRHFAHEYIAKHFDELEAGSVIDVEFLLGESVAPKLSESVTHPEAG